MAESSLRQHHHHPEEDNREEEGAEQLLPSSSSGIVERALTTHPSSPRDALLSIDLPEFVRKYDGDMKFVDKVSSRTGPRAVAFASVFACMDRSVCQERDVGRV